MRRPYKAGEKYNRLTLLEQRGPRTCGAWLCRCDCGIEKVIGSANDVRRGRVQSCGVCIYANGTGSAMFSPAEVEAIRVGEGPLRKAAKQYGCSATLIWKIRAREIYRHVQ